MFLLVFIHLFMYLLFYSVFGIFQSYDCGHHNGKKKPGTAGETHDHPQVAERHSRLTYATIPAKYETIKR